MASYVVVDRARVWRDVDDVHEPRLDTGSTGIG